jgi:hypothetical protein
MLVDTSTRLSKRVGGTFVPRISSAPFFWGVIASFARVYTSSSAPQCERIGPPGGRFLRSNSPYNWVLDTDTGTGPIPPITVSKVNAYSGGVLARALPEGLRYLST